MLQQHSRIYVAGHRGLVGSALVRGLHAKGCTNIITRTSKELDLRRQIDVEQFFEQEQPEFVIVAAAKVGGIHANNTYRADFLLDNLQIQNNVIASAYRFGVKKLLFLGSSCVYPKQAKIPITEDQLLTAPLEPTNEPYAIAKIAGLKLCEAMRSQYNFNAISCMPTNLYGPNDNFDPENSHVLPALIRKFVTATKQNIPEVVLWGTGTPKREFLHADDAASAMLFLMENYNDPTLINVGTGEDISIRELAEIIADETGFTGELVWDSSKPDGTMRKVMDVAKIRALGWEPKVDLRQGIRSTIEFFRQNYQV